MVDAGVQWTMPPQGVIKINAHGFFSDQPFENGNMTCIGFVFRDHKGHIVRMVGGSLGIEEERINEFYALLTALRRAYLETNNACAYWEWTFVNMEGVIPEHRYVVNQLEQRKADRNLRMDVRAISQESNQFSRYLAQYGARHWTQLVIIEQPFGRIGELWNNDMGLGPVGAQFQEFWEADLQNEDEMQEEVLVQVEEI
ncbi:hypothetical protein POM88_051137 [Heracleum sosnowskyi]|uniref:RNase H type-1 domain-containing protein n=1 Tax=Heracleum sosnowskyi TaxID=360622 RepID=A0AAD8H1L9_9APIA|nr:hypothetical protein POM88_051137 [Heracleum sosnowskyi]